MFIVIFITYLVLYIQLINVLYKECRLFNKEFRNLFRIFRTKRVLSDFYVVYIVMFLKQYINNRSTRRRIGSRRKIVARIVSIKM